MVDKLKEIFDVLDMMMGDTDPYIDEDWTEDEIKTEEPLFWVTREIGLLANK